MKNDNITTAFKSGAGGAGDFGRDFRAADDFPHARVALPSNAGNPGQRYRLGVEALANDAVAYSKQNSNSEILRILQPTPAKPANR